MRHPLTRRPRRGFTLVELLVACALTVLIMAVLATAFQTGLSTFSHLKSTVGLSEQLRAAEAAIRHDLEATHLENADGVAVKVSKVTSLPSRGYLEVLQGTEPNASTFVKEGNEDGVDSYRATNHAVFFTSKLKGNSPQEVFVGLGPVTGDPELADYAPAGSFVGQWAEIGLFLAPTAVMTIDDGVTPGSQLNLYSLYRRQRVLAKGQQRLPLPPDAGSMPTPTAWRNEYPELSISTQIFPDPNPPNTPYAIVNDPVSVRSRTNRLGYVATNTGSAPTETAIMPDATPAPPIPFTSIRSGTLSTQGTDILVTNVVSMQIRVMDGRGKFFDRFTQVPNPASPPGPPFLAGTGIAPPASYANNTTEGFRLDTAVPGTPQMRAIQIKLRVYDTKNHLTRQITMSFDL